MKFQWVEPPILDHWWHRSAPMASAADAIDNWLEDLVTCEQCGSYTSVPPYCIVCEFPEHHDA